MPRRTMMTLEEVARIYQEDCRVQGYKPSTIKGYRRTLSCFLRWAGEERITTLSQFTGETVKRYIAYTQQRRTYAGHRFTPEQQEPVSGTTVRNYARDLKAFAAWLPGLRHQPAGPRGRLCRRRRGALPACALQLSVSVPGTLGQRRAASESGGPQYDPRPR